MTGDAARVGAGRGATKLAGWAWRTSGALLSPGMSGTVVSSVGRLGMLEDRVDRLAFDQ
jgi:hypothetical protein